MSFLSLSGHEKNLSRNGCGSVELYWGTFGTLRLWKLRLWDFGTLELRVFGTLELWAPSEANQIQIGGTGGHVAHEPICLEFLT